MLCLKRQNAKRKKNFKYEIKVVETGAGDEEEIPMISELINPHQSLGENHLKAVLRPTKHVFSENSQKTIGKKMIFSSEIGLHTKAIQELKNYSHSTGKNSSIPQKNFEVESNLCSLF